MRTIDLNADLGESFGRWTLGDDAAMLRIVTSANVACGFHAGDPTTLLSVCRSAAAEGVTIGAQVGYRDLAGFGRRFIDVAPADLTADVIYQVGALDALARVAGTRVAYVKPHGALYTAMTSHEGQARAVVEAVRALDPSLPLVGLPGSLLLRMAAEAGLATVGEAFADRAYRADGTLVPRSEPDAVIDDPEVVAARVVRLVTDGGMVAVDGTWVPVLADSVCVHGDSPGAVGLASVVRAGLAAAGVRVAPFVGAGAAR
ncbi:LamB/YcsF family protein [Nostocoides sp. HKS02]|uniref:LamB/YcsF family protein n=1 Tax=Nostocoides sp. HKS02 TaxID=1813880 RepID=UPI0012B4A036|nr:5-oxoprolinase subunit PxpA [Tetrasphaera sp. HKS02]QGN56750.1 5-oxoprolinase subunit PxpA [Tetrasphaera sp. HKS02]